MPSGGPGQTIVECSERGAKVACYREVNGVWRAEFCGEVTDDLSGSRHLLGCAPYDLNGARKQSSNLRRARLALSAVSPFILTRREMTAANSTAQKSLIRKVGLVRISQASASDECMSCSSNATTTLVSR
jgi:hypothetical protein